MLANMPYNAFKCTYNYHSCSSITIYIIKILVVRLSIRLLDSREDIAWVIVIEVVDSAFGFLPLQVFQERETASKLMAR